MTTPKELVERLRRQGDDVVNSNLGAVRASLLEAADLIDRLTAPTPNTALADAIETAIEHFHDALPQGQGETGDDGRTGRALCQLFYDNSDAICAALRQPSGVSDDDVERVARALEIEAEECGFSMFSDDAVSLAHAALAALIPSKETSDAG